MKLRRPTPSPETVVVLAVVAFGALATAEPLVDNSMLWHLRTGMDMVATGEVPTDDPYSFTAAGTP